ncbi:MAG: sodium:solute symporter family protein, partial [Peptococcaceae bacterium]|nr:sodium:solute symporter family protein [Peptococcaceae bacterium]
MNTSQIMVYAVVACYVVVMIAVGLYFRKKAQSSTAKFWSADASIGWFVNSFAILATIMSGGGMMGNIGAAATMGIVFVLMGTWSTCLGTGVAAILVVPPLRKSGAKTLADFIHIRYRSKAVGTLCGIVIASAYTVYLVAQLKAGGTVSEGLLGLNYMTGNVAMWAIFTLYTILGGMLAVTWNDFIQGILMVVVVVGCSVLALTTYGGFGDMMRQTVEIVPNIGLWYQPMGSQIGVFIIWFLIAFCAPTVLMRVATAKSPFSAGMAMHTAMLWLTIFVTGTIAVLGPATRLNAGTAPLPNADAYILKFVTDHSGPVFQGLVASAVFAAIMSTAAGLLLAASAALANDVIKRHVQLSEKAASKVGLASIMVISVVALLLSFNPPPLLSILYSEAMAFLLCSLFFAYFLGMWWKRATTQGALAAIITGGGLYLFLRFGFNMALYTQVLYALPASCIVMVVVSLLTPKPDPEIAR